MNNILKDIIAPSLESPLYGEDINEQFKSIDNNFDRIITSEFLRGAKGDSFGTYEVEFNKNSEEDLIDNGLYINEKKINSGQLYQMIVDSITQNYSDQELESTPDSSWWDNLMTNNKLLVIVEKVHNINQLSAIIPYIHSDARFAGKLNSDKDRYIYLSDTSCALYWSDGKFVKMNNFPTLYYNQSLNEFCWIFNNKKTDLIARGPQGKAGRDGELYIVQVKKNQSGEYIEPDASGLVEVDKAMAKTSNGFEFIDIRNPNVFNIQDGDKVIGFYSTKYIDESGEEKFNTDFIISPIVYDENTDTWSIYRSMSNSISNLFNAEILLNALLSIGSSNLRGLFIPATEFNSSNQTQPGHMIYASLADSLVRSNLYIAPVEDVLSGQTPIISQDRGKLNIMYNTSIDGTLNVSKALNYNQSGWLWIGNELFINTSYEFLSNGLNLDENKIKTFILSYIKPHISYDVIKKTDGLSTMVGTAKFTNGQSLFNSIKVNLHDGYLMVDIVNGSSVPANLSINGGMIVDPGALENIQLYISGAITGLKLLKVANSSEFYTDINSTKPVHYSVSILVTLQQQLKLITANGIKINDWFTSSLFDGSGSNGGGSGSNGGGSGSNGGGSGSDETPTDSYRIEYISENRDIPLGESRQVKYEVYKNGELYTGDTDSLIDFEKSTVTSSISEDRVKNMYTDNGRICFVYVNPADNTNHNDNVNIKVVFKTGQEVALYSMLPLATVES